MGFYNDIPSLIRILEGFLKTCRKVWITLNPIKRQIGVSKVKFYGFVISDEKGMEPVERNLDPTKRMTTPTNRSEVRNTGSLINTDTWYDRLVLHIEKNY